MLNNAVRRSPVHRDGRCHGCWSRLHLSGHSVRSPPHRRHGLCGRRRGPSLRDGSLAGGSQACNDGDMPIPFWLPMLLGFLIAVGPAATDMYLPAFPAVEASFGTAARHGAAYARHLVRRPGGRADHPGHAVRPVRPPPAADRRHRAVHRWPASAARWRPRIAGCCRSSAPSRRSAASAGMVIPRAVVRDLADGHAGGHPDVAADAGDGRRADPGAHDRRRRAGVRPLALSSSGSWRCTARSAASMVWRLPAGDAAAGTAAPTFGSASSSTATRTSCASEAS